MEAFFPVGVVKTSLRRMLFASPKAKWMDYSLFCRRYNHKRRPISFTRRFSNTPSPLWPYLYYLRGWSLQRHYSYIAAVKLLPFIWYSSEFERYQQSISPFSKLPSSESQPNSSKEKKWSALNFVKKLIYTALIEDNRYPHLHRNYDYLRLQEWWMKHWINHHEIDNLR